MRRFRRHCTSARSNSPIRIECMIHLVLSAYDCGRPAECLRWADEAIALGATSGILRSTHRMAGVACSSLGRPEDPEQHFRLAYDAAAAEKNAPTMAEDLGSLARCLYKRGKLVEANEACLNATTMDPKAARQSLAVQSAIFWNWGRYDDALAVLARHKDVNEQIIPYFNRRVVAHFCDRHRPHRGRVRPSQRSLVAHPRNRAEFSSDAKLSLICEAATSWVLSPPRGLSTSHNVSPASSKRSSPPSERDPSTCRSVLYDLGMAACTRGDHHAGIACWTRYLALSPDPVYQPTAYYHRGECHRQLAQLSEAINDYQAAVALNLDTHFSQLARRRLGELTLPVKTPFRCSKGEAASRPVAAGVR